MKSTSVDRPTAIHHKGVRSAARVSSIRTTDGRNVWRSGWRKEEEEEEEEQSSKRKKKRLSNCDATILRKMVVLY